MATDQAKPVLINKDSELEGLLSANKEYLSVLTFVAPWSKNCKNMMDLTREFAADPELKQVLFVELTAEEVPSICAKFEINSVPSVLFVRDENVIEKMVGADVRNYADKVLQLATDGGNVTGVPTRSVKTAKGDAQVSPASTKVSLEDRLKQLINQTDVMVFMKGDPEQPRCGFSRQVVQILKDSGLPFKTFDILEDEDVRQGLKSYSNWQTYPQIYVKGQLIGGLDVLRELQEMDSLMDTLTGNA